MERDEFESILKIHLDPINKAIEKLEANQEQIVTILTNQARQDESIKHLRDDMTTCEKNRDEIFNRLRSHEQDGGDKVWDTLKMVLTGVGAFILSLLAGKIKI